MNDFTITKYTTDARDYYIVSVAGLPVAKLTSIDITLLAGVADKVQDHSNVTSKDFNNKYDLDDFVRRIFVMKAGPINISGYQVRDGEGGWFEPHLTYLYNGGFVGTVSLTMLKELMDRSSGT